MTVNANDTYRPLTPKVAFQLAAPHTWVASVYPALFGILTCWLKGYPLGPVKAPALLLTCVLMQSAVNALNDYFDFVKGTDSAEDNVEVSDAALVYAGVNPKNAKWLGISFLSLAAILGLSCCMGSGWAPILVGLLGGVIIVLYSGGPLPVSYLPIGEVVSGVTMGGLIPLGIVACATGEFKPEVLAWSLPFILGIGLIMMSNNGCDIEKDVKAGRRTLPTLLGRERTLSLYRVLTSFWVVFLMVLSRHLAGNVGLIPMIALVLLGGKSFRKLHELRLAPEQRIVQMKAILAANLFGNGAYLAAVTAALLLEVAHG